MASTDALNATASADPPAPQIPLPPEFQTRPSPAFMLAGNGYLLLALILYLSDAVPAWLMIGTTGVVAITIFTTSISRSDKINKWYSEERLREIQSYIESEQERKEFIKTEAEQVLNLQPANDFILFLSLLLLALPFPIFVFLDINAWAEELVWPLRWLLSGLVAALCALIVFLIWAPANMTAALINKPFAVLRHLPIEPVLEPDDENDIHIIRQIANLHSHNRRVESYTLESALLSALSFSSFMAIILADDGYIDTLRNIFPLQIVWSPWAWAGGLNYPSLPFSYVESNIVGLIGISLLFCAATFLGVLIARLRFNDGYRDADSLLKAAGRLNEKEDQAIEQNKPEKAAAYASSINDMLAKVDELERGLNFTMMHMRISRNAGIFFFVVTVVLCGLFFNAITAFTILGLFVILLLLGYADRFARSLLRKRVFNRGLVALLQPFRRGP